MICPYCGHNQTFADRQRAMLQMAAQQNIGLGGIAAMTGLAAGNAVASAAWSGQNFSGERDMIICWKCGLRKKAYARTLNAKGQHMNWCKECFHKPKEKR